MELIQLRDYIDELLKIGVRPNIPVCVCMNDLPTEAGGAGVYDGTTYRDPAPRLSSYTIVEGQFLLITPFNLDADEILAEHQVVHTLEE